MTVSSVTSRWSYNGNGSTDTFAYTTKIFATSDLDVYVDGVLKTLTTHYTVTGAGEDSGGNVVFTSGNIPAAGTANVVIVKDVPYTQPSSLPLGGSFLSTIVEGMVDRITILVQQSLSTINRTLRQAPADATDIGALPVKADRADKLLAFDSNGDPTATVASDLDLSTVTAFASTLLDDANAAAARTTLELGTAALSDSADFEAADADILKADTADVLTKGFAGTPYNAGTQSTGTFTPDEANGNLQYAVNGGAHTLAPPTNNCTMIVQYTNNGSAGTITTSGFTLVDGDAISTTNGDDFFFFIVKNNAFSSLTVKALQ